MTKRKVIQLEFNELCPALLERWMAEGLLPNFKAFYQNSEVYVTESDDNANLEPWIQWYSVHTGLSFQQHGVYHLTDGPKANHPDIWQILLAEGKSVGNCSSMNAKGFVSPGSFFLPDPWCTSEQAYPTELGIFHAVVASLVQQHTNADRALSLGDYVRFLWFLSSHGLRIKTVGAILRQLLLDRFIDKQEGWRRAVLLDKLQFDVFRYYFRNYRPEFSTFFLNSTAHYQHSYWRHMSPESFTVQPSEEERRRYGGAILFGYQSMDRLLGDFFKFESDDVTLILATALSQQAFLKREASGGQHFYRPVNIESMLSGMGIHPLDIRPVMAQQFVLRFRDDAEAREARAKLEGVSYQGTPVFDFAPSDPDSIYTGCQIFSALPPDAVITLADGTSVRFFELFYALGAVKSGSHHPDGVLWIKSGQHRVHSEKLSILAILPILLRHYGVSHKPKLMHTETAQ